MGEWRCGVCNGYPDKLGHRVPAVTFWLQFMKQWKFSRFVKAVPKKYSPNSWIVECECVHCGELHEFRGQKQNIEKAIEIMQAAMPRLTSQKLTKQKEGLAQQSTLKVVVILVT